MSIPSSSVPNYPPTSARGDIRNEGEPDDSGNDVGTMYLGEVKEDDHRITDALKEDANGILVFSGLFTATVGAFVIEFYKKLSPDSGDQTVVLLGQVLQQLASGNHSNATIQPSPPSAPMVWVNAMWLISLVLSLTSAFIATLLQEWARGYIETPTIPSEPKNRARVRWFLFLGMDVYKIRLLIQVVPTLLHLSVCLFFAGLAITFHTINTKVAIAVDVSVGTFMLAYMALSFLSCLDCKCPYRTPMSRIMWDPCHISLIFTARCLRFLVKQLYGWFVEPSLDGSISSPMQRKLVYWLDSCDTTIRKHWRYVMDGFEKSVINGAVNAQEGDYKIFSYLFRELSLSDKSKLRKLAASIPRHKILDLIRPVESGKIGLRDPLLVLLRSCEADAGATGPEEEARKRALLVCLDAIHHISKTPEVPELNFVRAKFANIGLMRTLWDDSDTAIRVTSRSICALIARQIGRRGWLGEEELLWLQGVTGETPHEILNADVETRDRMNFKSFVHGVLSNQVGDLPITDATSFKETLAILLDVRDDLDFNLPLSQDRLFEEVRRILENDPEDSRDVNKLLSMFPIPHPFPVPTIQSVSQ